MCDDHGSEPENKQPSSKTIRVTESVGTVLAHDITEIRPGEFKGRAFKKGHVIREEDVCHLQRLGKEHLFVLHVAENEMHENDAAYAIAKGLMGGGVAIKSEPKEGKISIIAERDGLLKIDRDALLEFNMLGEVMCATLHDNTVVKKGQDVAGTRAIPLVVKKSIVEEAVRIGDKVRSSEFGIRSKAVNPQSAIRNPQSHGGVIEVKEIRRPKVGVVITGNEVYHGRIKDAFAPVITKKIEEIGGELVGVYYAPDDKAFIVDRLRELLNAGADLLITTGGMSVDPDDVTRFAIRELGAADITYGSAVLPGAMFLTAYLGKVPILGIPACGMYAKTTIFDLVLPRVLAGEKIGRRELAELGHGGLCMKCDVCRYPVCPFGKLG
jgi:molybdenum cofactor synthesis domain-containing protein